MVVEDAPAGIEAAHRAGMPVVGVGDAARLSNAEVHCANLVALSPDLFDRLVNRSAARVVPGELLRTRQQCYNDEHDS